MKSLKKQGGFFAVVTIPAVASAVGAYASYQGTQSTNETNTNLAIMNNDRATQLANTAHQREVQDLIAAGLNPILSVNRSGAATPTMNTPVMMNPMQHAASSGADLARSVQTGIKYHQEIKNLEQANTIRSPLETIGRSANDGINEIKSAVQGTIGGLLEFFQPSTADTPSGLSRLIGGVQNIGEKTANTVSASSASALDRLGNATRTFGHKIQDVVTAPQKYIEQRINSAKDYADKATPIQDIHDWLTERQLRKGQDRTRISGPPSEAIKDIQRIPNPQERAYVLKLYMQQLNRQGR